MNDVHADDTNYAVQSSVTDPGQYAHLLDDLPSDLAGVARVVQGLVYHYMAGQYMFGYCPPQERMAEIDTRYAERILARLIELDDRPLTEPRAYEDRIVGCCRDFSLLACAILRHQGTPARLRYGFASYFDAGYWGDHVIVEAWNGSRWQRFDPQLAGVFKTDYDLFDIPAAAFATGGRAWQMCRNEGADPLRFGLGPHVEDVRGWWFVRGRLQLDLASLNKQELLCWDQWRYGEPNNAPIGDDEALLDRAAALSLLPDSAELRALWRGDTRLRLPESVTCFSPARGAHSVSVNAHSLAQ